MTRLTGCAVVFAMMLSFTCAGWAQEGEGGEHHRAPLTADQLAQLQTAWQAIATAASTATPPIPAPPALPTPGAQGGGEGHHGGGHHGGGHGKGGPVDQWFNGLSADQQTTINPSYTAFKNLRKSFRTSGGGGNGGAAPAPSGGSN